LNSDYAGLTNAILHNPYDDGPRLALADWFDENAGPIECEVCNNSGLNRMANGELDPAWACPVCDGASNGFAEKAELIRLGIKLAEPTPTWHEDCGPECQRCQDQNRHEFLMDGPAGPFDIDTTVVWPVAVRRGFVEEVHLSSTVFFGKECPKCRGHGRHADHSEAECVACGGKTGTGRCGTGLAVGNAKELFSKHPLLHVRFVEREPDPVGTDWCFRFRGERWSSYRGFLPQALMSFVPQLRHAGWLQHYYDEARGGWTNVWSTREAAFMAVSEACVRWGRKQAGLPELPSAKHGVGSV
jgi:uncharacterized protein (TIGR02996 family)